jgi:uncharacterized metal-binding protein
VLGGRFRRGVKGREMPGFRTHDLIGTCAAPVLAAGAYAVTHNAGYAAVAVGAHLFGTRWLSPDLDLESSEIAYRWGVLRWLWYPYGRIIPHRSIFSHSGLSALLRVLYLVVAVELVLLAGAALGLWGWRSVNGHILQWLAANQPGVAWALIGLVASDVVHTVSDHVSTSIKVWRRGGDYSNYRRELGKHT